MEEIQGIVSEIIYRNEQNGYTVLDMDCEGIQHTAVGFFAALKEGEMIKVQGAWTAHKDYGEQFKVETWSTTAPATLVGMEKYLASGIIHGIGPSTAKKLMEHFGLETIDIIQYNPQRLTEVESIGMKKAEKIHEAFEAQKEMKDIMLFLEQYDISPNFAVKIFKQYGGDTIKNIRENPYRLAEDVFGIGFRMADKVAMSMGYSSTSEFRLESGILYTLTQNSQGHTFIPRDELLQMTVEALDIDQGMLENALVALFIKKKIVTDKVDGMDVVYLGTLFRAEVGVAKRLLERSCADEGLKDLDIHAEMTLAKKQEEAIRTALSNAVTVITGGPGTGKTTIIKTMIHLLTEQKQTVLLAAPTGRAAKRMQEATGVEAKTIHRLLEYGVNGEESGDAFFQRNEDLPLEADVMIVDEASMIDILLMNSLLKAIPEGMRLIIVGDADQLPSVGVGNVLRDIISSGKVKTVHLDEIFRQAQESLIIVNAHKINHGELPDISRKDKDFFFIKEDNQSKIAQLIAQLCSKRLKKFTGQDPFTGIQVLTPMRKSECGVNSINLLLQKELNPPAAYKKEKIFRETIFRQGDKVMQIKNNYKLKWQNVKDATLEGEGVFNGDMGILRDIDTELQMMSVLFDGERIVDYEFANLDELELAYALTVHKSQGSEFPVVVMPITYGPPMLLTRNLLYTALTRAREMVVLVGNERYLKQMIENDHITQRYSGLKYRLEKLGDENGMGGI